MFRVSHHAVRPTVTSFFSTFTLSRGPTFLNFWLWLLYIGSPSIVYRLRLPSIMLSLPFILALAAGLLALQYAWSAWTHSRKARGLRCASIPRYPTDIVGLSSLKEALQADKVKGIPLMLQRRVEKMSTREKRLVTTFRIRQMGRENIFTCDPQNVQAMLATKFKDFELGPGRRHTLLPLLGAGIVSTIFSRRKSIDLARR